MSNSTVSDLNSRLETLAQQIDKDPTIKVASLIDQLAQDLERENSEKTAVKESKDIRVLISKMTMSEKIKTAMFGDAVARSLLIKDPNKLIQQFVLKNPQITMEELHSFALDPNTPQGVLRTISDTQKIVREYSIKQALCFNPKTPLDISMKWVRYLHMADLTKLQKSKSVPNALTVIVRKKIADSKKKK